MKATGAGCDDGLRAAVTDPVGPVRAIHAVVVGRVPRPSPWWVVVGAAAGVCVAGMWNARAVDGLGVAMFVTPLVGSFEDKAQQFPALGFGFGARFAVAAGLAATVTASSVATLSLLPGLAWVSARSRGRATLGVPAAMLAAVAAVAAIYGAFVGRMGPDGAAAFNTPAVRSAQSFVVYGTLGVALLLWAALDAGLVMRSVSRGASRPRRMLAQPLVRAALSGVIAGAFSAGRPLAVFREFLLYASQPQSAWYGAVVMALQALATVAIPIALLTMVAAFAQAPIGRWTAANPQRAALTSASAMAAGGAFLVFYWSLQRAWPAIGRWGFQLGLYQ
jgi:hypothetical protein